MKLIEFCPKTSRDEIHQKIKKYYDENRHNPTPAALAFQKMLGEMGIANKKEVILPVDGRVYFCDFLLRPPLYILVEIDGGIHKKQEVYDERRDENIMKLTGWPIIRFTNEQVLQRKRSMMDTLVPAIMDVAKVEEQLGNRMKSGSMKTLYIFVSRNCPHLRDRYFRQFSISDKTRYEIIEGQVKNLKDLIERKHGIGMAPIQRRIDELRLEQAGCVSSS